MKNSLTDGVRVSKASLNPGGSPLAGEVKRSVDEDALGKVGTVEYCKERARRERHGTVHTNPTRRTRNMEEALEGLPVLLSTDR